MTKTAIQMVKTSLLRHIEGFSEKRVCWLRDKILKEGIWVKPLALDQEHNLVLDGQHRMEVALSIGLKCVPAVKYDYSSVKVWSLRENYEFDWVRVVDTVLSGTIYPYKTVKHEFGPSFPSCNHPLDELMI
jgi:L-serine kinase (ADP)